MTLVTLLLTIILGVFELAAPLSAERFDHVVRADFFAGFGGDEARLQKAMSICESILADDPRHAEAMVWHGAGLLFQGGRSFQAGDAQRLKALEDENRRLKRLVADLALDNAALKDVLSKNW